MADFKRRRSALLNVIQGLEDSDVVSDEVVEMDEIEENIPETTEELAPVANEEGLPEDQDDDTIISDEELEEILSSLDDGEEACDEVEADEDLESCDEFEADDDEFACDEEKVASETEAGIEDEITDTMGGGEPTVSEVAPGGEEAKEEVQETSEVYPTESAYVASLVRKFDRIANQLEKKGMKRLAYRLDKISDSLEASYKK